MNGQKQTRKPTKKEINKTIEEIYPGFKLYNDVVNMLKDVHEASPEVRKLIDDAKEHWDDMTLEKCQPVIDHFSKLYPMLYKYHKTIFQRMILCDERVDEKPFLEFLKARKQLANGETNKEQYEQNFGTSLVNHYITPNFDKDGNPLNKK